MFCPICNGIQSFHESCSCCGGTLLDYGRESDWTGPYAPYEPIEKTLILSLSDQVSTDTNCTHIIYCPTCMQTIEVMIAEWDSN